MLNYPVHKISTTDKQVNILQITDLHLSIFDTDSSSAFDCQQSFEAVLAQALEQDIRCDLILVTGDLVDKVQSATYDYIFAVLSATNIPFACIAGNHDVTDEVGHELPFEQRQLVAHSADSRLLNRHVIETDCWQLLLINSAISGKVAGRITDLDIDWICEQLSSGNKPTLIALHHHLLPMQSKWVDAYIADNADTFWQRTAPFANLHVIINGHTHQEQRQWCNGVTVYTTPSTCYQFKPFEDDFAYDSTAYPGYRWLQLANNRQVASWVERLDT